MRARLPALVMALLLVVYLVFAIYYAIVLLSVDQPVAKGMGVALLVLPLIGFWVLGAELLFGVRSERLAKQLVAEGRFPDDELHRSPSGRADRRLADEAFPRYRAEVEAAPESWQAWFRLALAYDASGDRRRARWATREAIRFSRL